jgi:hypothetical protein
MCLWLSYKKKIWEFFLVTEERSRIRSWIQIISQRYGSGDPDQHQNDTDP